MQIWHPIHCRRKQLLIALLYQLPEFIHVPCAYASFPLKNSASELASQRRQEHSGLCVPLSVETAFGIGMTVVKDGSDMKSVRCNESIFLYLQ